MEPGETCRKRTLRRAFDAAAAGYDAAAVIQKLVAQRLARRIASLPLPPRPRILEIGCGTGLLSLALRQAIPDADWVLTDLSPAMIQVCRDRLGDPSDTRFLVMDGERPGLEPSGFDLVCASMAFQWFEDLPGALDRLKGLLAPGGWLAFATLGEDTLSEWRQAHTDLGLEAGTPAFTPLAALKTYAVETERLVHAAAGDGRAFLAGLKAIGAGSPAETHHPLGAGQLRRVLRRFEAGGGAATYHVAYGLYRRPARLAGVFVTGTDTGVGKTVVSACLARAWGADYWKPLQTGLDEDAGDTAVAAELAGLAPERLHPPVHAFGPPVSPHLAAAQAGVTIALDSLNLPTSPRLIVVEGAGGALVPLNGEVLTADLMVRLGLPVVVVVRDRLGAINQALLTLDAVRSRGLTVLGVVLTGAPFADNRAAIEAHGRVRIIAELPWTRPLTPEVVAAWAALIPPLGDLAG